MALYDTPGPSTSLQSEHNPKSDFKDNSMIGKLLDAGYYVFPSKDDMPATKTPHFVRMFHFKDGDYLNIVMKNAVCQLIQTLQNTPGANAVIIEDEIMTKRGDRSVSYILRASLYQLVEDDT